MRGRLGNYLRVHRTRTGLFQREIGQLLGYTDHGEVSRHELSASLPTLVIALAYEVILRVPVSELFAGITETLEPQLEHRLRELRAYLSKRLQERPDSLTKRKLAWLDRRLAGIR